MKGTSTPRIAILLPRFSQYGGVEQFGYYFAKALAEKKYAVDFICARQEVEAPDGVRILLVGRPKGLKSWKMLWFLIQAERLRKKGDYDLSISLGKTWRQDVSRVGGGPIRNFWRLSERAYPTVWGRVKKRLSRCFSPSNWLTWTIEKHQFSNNGHVIANSHLVRDWLMTEHSSLSSSNVDVIYNKPDLTRFYPPSIEERVQHKRDLLEKYPSITGGVTGEVSDLIFLGTATQNFRLKGIEQLISALVFLPKDIHFFIAGKRRSAFYEKKAKQLGVADRVHFCGKVTDMPFFYKGLDIFILASFHDACSNAVLEALASGCKTISTTSNGSSYFLPPDAVVDRPESPRELVKAVLRQLTTPPPETFVWPSTVASGMDKFVNYVESLLVAKRQNKRIDP